MKIFYLSLDKGISPHGTKGASAHVRELASALAGIGHDVVVVARNVDGPELLQSSRIRVVPINPTDRERALVSVLEGGSGELISLLQNSEIYGALMNLLQRESPDAILERLSLFSFAGLAASKSYHIPYLLEVDAPLSQEAATYRSLDFRGIAELLERSLLRGADVVLPVSTALCDWAIRGGALPEHVQLLPNGVDTRQFDPSKAQDMRSKLQFEGAHVLGFVGGLRPWHGLGLLARAFDIIAARDARARLLVVGDGPRREYLENWRREKRDVSDRVVIVGHVPHADIPNFLATMDVVFAPYEDIPGFYFSPLKVLEAMAMARPIVASAIGDIPGLLLEGKAGMLVQPGEANALADAAERLLNDPNLAAQLGTAARECVIDQHDWRDVARKIEGLVGRASGVVLR